MEAKVKVRILTIAQLKQSVPAVHRNLESANGSYWYQPIVLQSIMQATDIRLAVQFADAAPPLRF